MIRASRDGQGYFSREIGHENPGVRYSVVLLSRKTKARENVVLLAGFLINPGDFLLSHTVTRAVPSAPTGLTSVFGMGTVVTLSTKSPESCETTFGL